MTDEKFLKAYEMYKNTVFSVIYSYTKSADDAAELSQDTFIRLYTYDGSFDSDEHMKAWLIRVAINICNNHFRSRKHISASPVPEDLPSEEQHKIDELINVVMKLPENTDFLFTYSITKNTVSLKLQRYLISMRLR